MFLIEVQSENQGKKVMQIKKLGGLEVQVTEHKAFNQSKYQWIVEQCLTRQ